MILVLIGIILHNRVLSPAPLDTAVGVKELSRKLFSILRAVEKSLRCLAMQNKHSFEVKMKLEHVFDIYQCIGMMFKLFFGGHFNISNNCLDQFLVNARGISEIPL